MWLVLPLLATLAQGESRHLTVDRLVTGVLDRSADSAGVPETRFELSPPSNGWITIRADSFDFDPAIEVLDESRTRIAADEDSGVGTSAWLIVEARSGKPLHVRLYSQDGSAGEFQMSVSAGRLDPPAGQARSRASAEFYRNKGQRLLLVGDRAKALVCFERCAKLATESGDPALASSASSQAGDIRKGDAELAKARADLDAAKRLRSDPAPSSGTKACEQLDACAAVFGKLGAKVPELEARSELAATARDLGDPLREALALASLASLRSASSDVQGARGDFDRALALLEKLPAPDPAKAAEILSQAGRFFVQRAEYARGTELLDRAFEVDPSAGSRVGNLGFLVNAALGEGRFGMALRRLDELSTLAASSPDVVTRGGILFTTARIEIRLGQFEEARAHLDQLLELVRNAGYRPGEVDTLLTLSTLQEATDQLPAARESGEHALAIAREINLADSMARILVNLGRLDRLAGDLDGARKRFEEALQVARAAGERDAESGAVDGRALLALQSGDWEQAQDLARQAYDLNVANQATENALFPLNTMTRAAIGAGRLDEARKNLVEAERVLDRADVSELMPAEAAGVRSRFVLWGETAQDLAAAWLASKDATSAARDGDRLDGWRRANRWKGRALREGIARRFPGTHLTGDALRADRLSELLGPSRALVEYAQGADHLYAYSLFRGVLRFHDLGAFQPIRVQVGQVVDSFAKPVPGKPASELVPISRSLCKSLLDPCLADFSGAAESVVFVPTAELGELPFEALVLEDKNAPGHAPLFRDVVFVLDRFEVSYAPASSVLLDLAERPKRAKPSKALVVGDAVYSEEASASSASSTRGSWPPPLPRLPETRDECLDLAGALLTRTEPIPQKDLVDLERERRDLHRDVAMNCGSFDLDLGRSAKVALFNGDLSDYSLIHLAVHGLVDGADPRRTSIALSADAKSDGLLTLQMVTGIQLNADLVVLSACDSARGRVLRGEGVQSMANAFLLAGARGAVASLWQVRDLETESTMKRFYAVYLGQGRSASHALVEAKRKMRMLPGSRNVGVSVHSGVSPVERESANPYFWAPFIFVGDVR